jgi:Leucine-rich repeat (LRR) protein
MDLEVLILAENALATLPEEIGQLTSLRTLDLGHNRLERLPQSFSQLKGLKDYLYLQDNCLTELDDKVFEGFASLKYLNLSANPGLRLPGSIAALNNLEELRLEKLVLTSVPGSIGSLASLEELSLRDNGLESLPHSFSGLCGLRRLDLRGNRFRLPPVLGSMTKLTKLDMRWNPLEADPGWLATLRDRECRVLL